MKKVLNSINKRISPVAKATGIFGAFCLFGMMILMVADVSGRYFFNSPITGTYEISSTVLVFVTIFSIVYCQYRRGNISVDLITSRIPRKPRNIWNGIMHVLALGTFCLLTFQLVRYGITEYKSGGLIQNTVVPSYPFIFVMALACFILSMFVLLQTLIFFSGGFEE